MRLAALERWWLAPRPLQALIGARIVFGAVVFIAYALRLPAYLDLFGPRGIGGPEFAARMPELPPLHAEIAPFLDVLRLVPSEAAITALYALLMLASAAFTVGLFTPVAGALTWLLHVLFWVRNPIAFVGWASYLPAPLLYVVLAPVGRHLSIDAWRRRRRGEPAASWYAPGWRLRLLQVQVCCMYAVAGWSRLDKPGWMQGEMVQIALTSANFSRVAIDWSAVAPLLALGTWGTVVLEALAPVLLWLPRTRRLWAGLLFSMHAVLAVLTHVEIWAWSAILMAGLLAFFFSDAEPETSKG